MFFKPKNPTPENINSFIESWKQQCKTPLWFAFQFNQTHFQNTFENTTVECHFSKTKTLSQKRHFHQFRWGTNQVQNEPTLSLEGALSSKKILSGDISLKDFPSPNFSSLIHDQFKEIRNLLVECGHRKTLQAESIFDETRAKEWLRVSLEVLKEALKKVKTDRLNEETSVLQGLLFCGYHPTRDTFIFRLRLFNLDLSFEEGKKQELNCIVLNKKNSEDFKNIEPALTQSFHLEKSEIINMLIKLLPYISECVN